MSNNMSGKDLTYLLGGSSLEESYYLVDEAIDKYHGSGLFEAKEEIEDLLREKNHYSKEGYFTWLAKVFYEGLSTWIDVKWLALGGKEVEIVRDILSGVTEIIYVKGSVAPRDYVRTMVLGEELLKIAKQLEGSEQDVSTTLFSERRLNVVEALHREGVTKQNNLKYSPEEISDALVSNTKKEGERLQLKPSEYRNLLSDIGLVEDVSNPTDEEVMRNYANVYKLLNRKSTSNRLIQIDSWVQREVLTKDIQNINGFKARFFRDVGIIVYQTSRVYLVIGTRVALYQRLREDRVSLVSQKSIHKIRARDIVRIVQQF